MFLPLVYLLTLPVVLVIICLYIVALLWKFVVWLLLRFKHGRTARILPGVDAISQFPLLKVNEAANNVIVRIQGQPSIDALRRNFKERLLDLKDERAGHWKHPKMRQYFTEFMGFQVAIDDPDFNYEKHFDFYRDCQENAVTYRDDDDLTIILEDLINGQMFESSTTSPWKIYVVPKRDNREYMILVKADHALFDAGAASMVLFPTITDNNESVEAFQNMKRIPLWVRLWYHFRGLMILPFGTLMQFFSEQDNNPIHRHDRETKQGKYITFPALVPLQRLNEIRKATDVKINSIVLTCVSRAVTRFAEEKFGSSESAKWTWTCHQPISMWMPGDQLELINRISAVATPLPHIVTSSTSALDHLQIIKDHVKRVFVVDAIWSGYTFLKMGINTFPKCITVPLARRSFTHPTLGLSNIRGGECQFSAFGQPVTLFTGYLPLIKTWDLGVVVTSYSGDMAISVTGRKSAFENAGEMKQIQLLIVEEIDSLYKQAMALPPKKQFGENLV